MMTRIRKPVRRSGAEDYILLTLLSFAASVSLTRLFLELTGYPQLGNSELHIAHVLWGGLLLFIASLLPLILANRWVYIATAILSGVGVGLFIDEVGKFITQSNNYFYPPAAPIIYAFFLLTVLLYTQVRRSPPLDARSELYKLLDQIQEVLDHDLDPLERDQMIARLTAVTQQAQQPELARLAQELLHYLVNEKIYLVPVRASFIERVSLRLHHFLDRWVHPTLLRAVLSGGLLALGIVALFQVFPLLTINANPARIERELGKAVELGLVTGRASLSWFSARLALEGLTGVLLITSAVLLAFKSVRLGARLGSLSLLLSLTAVDLIMFYFDQFSAISTAGIQFLLLMGLLYYRHRFIKI